MPSRGSSIKRRTEGIHLASYLTGKFCKKNVDGILFLCEFC